MKTRNHLIMSLVTLLAWGVFYVIGIPSHYFTNWTVAERILILWLGFFSIFPFFCIIVTIFLEGDFFKNSVWLALYASIGLFLLDFIAIGLIQREGLTFLLTHWHLSIAYIEALLIIPLTGYAMKTYKNRNCFRIQETGFSSQNMGSSEKISKFAQVTASGNSEF